MPERAVGSAGSAGGDLSEYRFVKVDIHQCLTPAKHQPDLKPPNPGAIEFLKAVLAQPQWGIKLSCGGFRDGGAEFRKKVDLWLARYGIDRKQERILYIPDDRYIATINDRSIDYEDNWPQIQKAILRMIKEAEATKSPDVPNDL